MLAAPYTAAELVKLRQPEAVCAVDEDDAGVAVVYAHLHNGRGHQHVQLATLEPAHHVLLVAERQPAVQQAERQVRKHLRRQAMELGGGCPRLQHVRLLDERADHEGLSAERNLTPHKLVGVAAPLRGNVAGSDGLPPRRLLIEH